MGFKDGCFCFGAMAAVKVDKGFSGMLNSFLVFVLGKTRQIPPHISPVSPNLPSFCPDLVKIVSNFDQSTRALPPNLKYFDQF